MITTQYLIHFDKPFHGNRHLLGQCKKGTLTETLASYRFGKSTLFRQLSQYGVSWQLTHVQHVRKIRELVTCPVCADKRRPYRNRPYFQRPEISNSDLGIYWHYLNKIPYTVPKGVFRLGSAVHEAILEPTKFQPENFKGVDLDMVNRCVDLFHCSNEATELLKGTTCETEKYSAHSSTGVPIRGKADILEENTVIDLKTTSARSQQEFEEACLKYGYDRSMAFYSDLFQCEAIMLVGISKTSRKLFFLDYKYNSPFIEKGRKKYEFLLNKLAGDTLGKKYIYAIRKAYST